MAEVKPYIWSGIEGNVRTGESRRVWVVEFVDGCGCTVESIFTTYDVALRFALHIANGGDRWEFV